ncbi:unnamed protein product [Symbiodinium sp. CCMP2592]|nr:unnamed protein product [Symbiodinium sp. CCMP2592]
MKNLLPEGTTFTTLSLNFNNTMQCHRDSNNEMGTKAYLVACGAFVGGALWCHDTAVKEDVTWNKVQGRWLPGIARPTYHQLVSFDPHQLHQPLPWEGMRYTITAYTVGCGGNCVSQDRHLLQGLGFPLPPHVRAGPEGGGSGVRGEMKSLRRPKSALRKFCGAFSSCAECDLVPGEDQTLESSLVGGGVSQGDPVCVCKGREVDPSLCTCRVSEVSGGGVPQKFYIGDEGLDYGTEAEINEEGSRRDDGGPAQWGAFGPPTVAKLEPLDGNDVESYYLLGSEVPLEVGWDLFEGHLDDLRLATVQEEYAEREQAIQRGEAGDVAEGPLPRWIEARVRLESLMENSSKWDEEKALDSVRKTEVLEDPDEAPLHTKTIPNEVVRRELQRWAPSMFSEYESLVRENEAVEPFTEAQLQEWKDAGRDYDLVPGKTVHTIKAFSGRLKTRAVICGNFLAQSFAREQKYAAGADSVLIRLVLREAARRGWRLAVLDVKTAFLLAPLLFQEKRPTLVLVPKLFLLAGICKEPMWRVRKALYGLSTSPKSWEAYRNQVMAKLRGRVPGGEVTLIPSGVDDSLWYVQVGTRRAGAVICYVDDLLIAAEPGVAEEVARMFTTTWKCTEPQWDDVTFNPRREHHPPPSARPGLQAEPQAPPPDLCRPRPHPWRANGLRLLYRSGVGLITPECGGHACFGTEKPFKSDVSTCFTYAEHPSSQTHFQLRAPTLGEQGSQGLPKPTKLEMISGGPSKEWEAWCRHYRKAYGIMLGNFGYTPAKSINGIIYDEDGTTDIVSAPVWNPADALVAISIHGIRAVTTMASTIAFGGAPPTIKPAVPGKPQRFVVMHDGLLTFRAAKSWHDGEMNAHLKNALASFGFPDSEVRVQAFDDGFKLKDMVDTLAMMQSDASVPSSNVHILILWRGEDLWKLDQSWSKLTGDIDTARSQYAKTTAREALEEYNTIYGSVSVSPSMGHLPTLPGPLFEKYRVEMRAIWDTIRRSNFLTLSFDAILEGLPFLKGYHIMHESKTIGVLCTRICSMFTLAALARFPSYGTRQEYQTATDKMWERTPDLIEGADRGPDNRAAKTVNMSQFGFDDDDDEDLADSAGPSAPRIPIKQEQGTLAELPGVRHPEPIVLPATPVPGQAMPVSPSLAPAAKNDEESSGDSDDEEQQGDGDTEMSAAKKEEFDEEFNASRPARCGRIYR